MPYFVYSKGRDSSETCAVLQLDVAAGDADTPFQYSTFVGDFATLEEACAVLQAWRSGSLVTLANIAKTTTSPNYAHVLTSYLYKNSEDIMKDVVAEIIESYGETEDLPTSVYSNLMKLNVRIVEARRKLREDDEAQRAAVTAAAAVTTRPGTQSRRLDEVLMPPPVAKKPRVKSRKVESSNVVAADDGRRIISIIMYDDTPLYPPDFTGDKKPWIRIATKRVGVKGNVKPDERIMRYLVSESQSPGELWRAGQSGYPGYFGSNYQDATRVYENIVGAASRATAESMFGPLITFKHFTSQHPQPSAAAKAGAQSLQDVADVA